MSKREIIPPPSPQSLEAMRGKVSEKKEVVLGSGEKKFVRLIKEGGGLLGVPDKKEWAWALNHALITRRVATYLARKLKAAGEDIDLETVGEAALLHDIGRRKEKEEILYDREHKAIESHPKKGAKILRKAGFSEKIAKIVETPHFPQKKELDNWEKKIVFYSDLRAGQDIVSLDDRLDDIAERWIPDKKLTKKEMSRAKEMAKDVEQEIFSKLDITPNDILDLPAPRVEKYLRTVVGRNLEDRAIKFFRGLEDRKIKGSQTS